MPCHQTLHPNLQSLPTEEAVYYTDRSSLIGVVELAKRKQFKIDSLELRATALYTNSLSNIKLGSLITPMLMECPAEIDMT